MSRKQNTSNHKNHMKAKKSYLQAKKSTSSSMLFGDIAMQTSYFRTWVCLVTHTQNDSIIL